MNIIVIDNNTDCPQKFYVGCRLHSWGVESMTKQTERLRARITAFAVAAAAPGFLISSEDLADSRAQLAVYLYVT